MVFSKSARQKTLKLMISMAPLSSKRWRNQGQGDISKPTLFAIKLSTLGTHDGYKHLRDERKEGHSNANFRNLDGQLVRR